MKGEVTHRVVIRDSLRNSDRMHLAFVSYSSFLLIPTHINTYAHSFCKFQLRSAPQIKISSVQLTHHENPINENVCLLSKIKRSSSPLQTISKQVVVVDTILNLNRIKEQQQQATHQMLSKRVIQVIAASAALAALAIGLGVTLGNKNNDANSSESSALASKGSSYNHQCRRLIDGRQDNVEDVNHHRLDFHSSFRNLKQWENDGYAANSGGRSKGSSSYYSKSKGSSYSKGGSSYSKSKGSSAYYPAICSKGSNTYPVYDPCDPVQYVPCACPTPNYSKGSSYSKVGYYYSKNKGSSSNSKSSYSKSSYGHRRLMQWENDGYSVGGGGGGGSKYSDGSKGGNYYSGGSKGGNYYSKSKGSYVSGGTCMCAVTPYGYNYSKGMSKYNSKGSYYSYSKGSKGSFVTGGSSCTCLAPAMVSKGSSYYYSKGSSKSSYYYSKGSSESSYYSKSKGGSSYGLVPVPCPCSEPVVPVQPPALCEPTPRPTPRPTPKPTFAFVIPPTTPAPTPCEAQRFFLVDGVCTNDVFLLGGTSYRSAMQCCNVNYGRGSMNNGNCEYVDICNTPAPVTPAPTPCGDQIFYFNGNICSNAMAMPGAAAYNTVMACCNMNFGMGSFNNGSCNIEDECNTPQPSPSPVTPAPTPCDAQVFYFDGSTCTNELVLGDDVSFYNSLNRCCNQNFGPGSLSGGDCEYTDICSTEPPTPSPATPSPTACEDQVFYFVGSMCTNELELDELILGELVLGELVLGNDLPFYNSLNRCCNQNFGPGSLSRGDCEYTDICGTEPPTPSPSSITNPPTFGNTPTVSTELTGPPTLSDRGN